VDVPKAQAIPAEEINETGFDKGRLYGLQAGKPKSGYCHDLANLHFFIPFPAPFTISNGHL
jgi:hypothetical protein